MKAADDLLDQLGRAAQEVLGDAAGSRPLAELKRRLAEIERRGEPGALTAEVVTAVPLTAAETAEFERRLRARYGQELPVAFHVDAAVLGGAVVRVGDRLLDGSTAMRLAQLREALLGAGGTGRSS